VTAAPILLALEASQRDASVALAGPFGLDHEPLRTRRKHDEDLMPAIDRLCARHGVAPAAIDAVAVSIGPGGFTGLRITVVTAKMLALAAGAQPIAVPSALVAAAGTPRPEGCTFADPVLVVLGAKRDHAWTSRVAGDDAAERDAARPGFDGWRELDPPRWGPVADRPLDDVRAVLADEHAPSDLLERARSANRPVIAPVLDARVLARLGAAAFAAGRTVDPHALAPLYGREPEAVSLWRERHG